MSATTISWTDHVWNPTRGCSRISDGCKNCYAENVAARFSGKGQPYEGIAIQRKGSKWTGKVIMALRSLSKPLSWTRPRRIFVDSMSDLFHEELTNEQIAAVFGVMAAAPRHTFQLLTKRAARLPLWFEWVRVKSRLLNITPRQFVLDTAGGALQTAGESAWSSECYDLSRYKGVWPLSNLWLGVSVEDQDAADLRIPPLLATPAAVHFLSCEPLIGPVLLDEFALHGRFVECPDEDRPTIAGDNDPCAGCPAIPSDECGAVRGSRIAWVIAGCESGSGMRRCDPDWLRSLRDQCVSAGVPFFLKQAVFSVGVGLGDESTGKARGVVELPFLDEKQWAQFPEAAR